jgi:hypothetical protein
MQTAKKYEKININSIAPVKQIKKHFKNKL